MMTKRAQGRKRFGRRNFKQRYFQLTTQSLSYSKSKGKRPICDIPLSEILAVERLNEGSFKMQNIFQIIRKDRPLYVQTTNCVEEKEWVDLLSKICQSNKARLENFHPCAFVGGMWSCCSQTDENAPGCKRVSNKPFQMELATALDPARDLQRLHTLIMSHLSRLNDYCSTTSATNSLLTSSSSTSSSLSSASMSLMTPTNYEDFINCKKTIRQLTEIALGLEKIHVTYKQILARELKYGSRQAPIGDDNYLHMIRNGLNGNTLASSTSSTSTTSSSTLITCPRIDVLRSMNSTTSNC